MVNRVTRTVLFAASALLSMSAFGAGAARFGTLRNSDWVVTNAWQAVSNKTHDLILEIGQGDSLPPNWQNVSNAAMKAVQSLQPATNYTDEVALDFEEGRRTAYFAYSSTFSQIATTLGDTDVAYTAQDLINESTNAAVAVTDTKISTNNASFVSAVLAAPLVGADPNDLSELAEYGSYGTVGAALLALIAGLAALKRRMTAAETAISDKANATDLPYAMVTPGEWEFSDGEDHAIEGPIYDGEIYYYYILVDVVGASQLFNTESDALAALSLTFDSDPEITATRASLPGHLLDRANNLVTVTANTTLTLPPFVEGKVRDLLVACTIGVDGNDEPWSVIFQGADGEEISFKAEGDDAASATFPVPTAAGDWWFSLTERAPHVFAVSLKQLQSVSQPTHTQGGS